MARVLKLLVPVAALAVAGAWMLSNDSDKKRAAQGEGHALEARIERLEGRVRAAEFLRAQPVASNSQERVEAAGEKEEVQEAPDWSERNTEGAAAEQDASAQQELAQKRRQIEERWAAEPVDRKWAYAAEAQLQDAFAHGEIEGLFVRADCKTSACRLSLTFDSAAHVEAASFTLTSHAPWSGQGFYQMDAEALTGVYYIAREGQSLLAEP